MSNPYTTERVISASAIALYTVACLAWLWTYAHDYARNADVNDPAGLAAASWIAAVFVIPLVAGFGVGRYWAPALILILLACGGITADLLEPLQRPELPEGETGPVLLAMIGVLAHAPLLLVGAWLRKRLWPRSSTKTSWLPTSAMNRDS